MKIFGIGLSRTGTTSLTSALGLLGYRIIHFPRTIGQIASSDGACDTPVAAEFVRLDRKFPGSRFIYTVRNRDSWLRSCEGLFQRRPLDPDKDGYTIRLRRLVYGTTTFSAEAFNRAYDRHEARVLAHFADRPDDLLVIDLIDGQDRWRRLCGFLGCRVPDAPFPDQNRAAYIEAFAVYVCRKTGNPGLATQLTGTPGHVLRRLLAEAGRDTGICDPTALSPSIEVALALVRAINHFGGIAPAGRALGIPVEAIRDSVAFLSSIGPAGSQRRAGAPQ